MARIDATYYSDVLGMSRTMSVIFPQRSTRTMDVEPLDDGSFPVLYLLHGLSDDHSAWTRYTSIERYVEKKNLVVIMPSADRSFYTDMVQGGRYFTHIAEELPRICRSMFHITNNREYTFVAGLSMGGYGAFKLAMTLPDRYAAAASLSGALDLRAGERGWENFPGEAHLVFGDEASFAGSANDLMQLASDLAESTGPRPKMYAWCGTEDFLHESNLSFRRHAEELGLELLYEEGPGNHQWLYWDRGIQRVLEWLPLHR